MSNRQKEAKPLLVVITGPTASGKTTLSVNIARHFNCKILSSDSRQFYKGMSVGSAAPSPEELAAVKHFFIGHLEVDAYYNVSKFEHDANNLLADIFKTEKIALLVGGSGLYIDAVCKGIDVLPDPSPELRAALQHEYRNNGLSGLTEQLKILDPVYFNKVDLNNPNRIIRALEVCLTSGKTYSSLRVNEKRERPYRIFKIGIETNRQDLHRRINERVDHMMSAGLENEVKSLLPWRNSNALKTVGYREIISYLDGEMTLDEAVEKIKTHTRNYARRQITWFKRDKEIRWFKVNEEEQMIKLIESQINC